MKKGECPTWFVVKWLAKHPTHTAEAPEANGMYASRVKAYAYTRVVRFEVHDNGIWQGDSAPYQRSDWTIRNERGREVRFKEKPELRRIGCVETGQELSINGISGVNASNSVVDVFIRERKR